MASSNLQAKYEITADVSKFSSGVKSAKQDLKDFDKTAQGALGSLGDAFGVNTSKVQQLEGAFRGLGAKMSASANEGVAAFGKMISACSGVATGIAGLGLGAAVTGFKLLTSEAEAFKKTVQGANIELQTAAYISTYKQVLSDMNSETGKSIAETQSKIKEWWAGLTSNVKAWGTAAIGNLLGISDVTKSDVIQGIKDANENAQRASEIAGEQYKIERQQAANKVKIAELDAQIAAQRERATDTELTSAERLEASNRAQELIRQKYALQIPLAQTLANLQSEMSSLASDNVAAENKKFQLQAEVSNLRAQEENELRALNKQQGTLSKAAAAEAEAAAKALAARKEMAELNLTDLSSSATNLLSNTGATALTVPTLQGGLHIDTDAAKEEVSQATAEIQAMVTSAFETVGESLGSLVGDLLTGGDAWGNFADSALTAFADMAASVGKLTIATGVALLGIKAGLKSLNPYAAIAAGTALVALAAAVKTGLNNIASGDYSGSSSVASSTTSSSSSNDWTSSEITVRVQGTLEADGNKLVAVINDTNKRNGYTT